MQILGIDVFQGDGHFVGPSSVEVGGQRLELARAVIATGARAAVLPIAGLAEVGYPTNETLFSLTELPRTLAILGSGPIGCEMAQSFRRFGSEVFLFETDARILPREDADAASIVERRLQSDGVQILTDAAVLRVERHDNSITVHYRVGGTGSRIRCDAILLGVGRKPNVEGLGLEAAGVAYDASGVTVNERLRTSNRNIYAAGDVASRFKFTHAADAMARIVIQNALFFGRKKATTLLIPWCTYTSPEVAHVGLHEHEAAASGQKVDTITVPMSDVDRAILAGDEEGFLRVHLAAGTGRILGATIVASRAGDMISEITVTMAAGKGLGSLASVIHPYPTQAEVIKKAADAHNRTRLTPTVRRLFERMLAARR